MLHLPEFFTRGACSHGFPRCPSGLDGLTSPRMKTVNIHEAKTNLSSLLGELEADRKTILICRNGEPVADLVPHQRTDRTKSHPVLGKIKIRYDPVAPLTREEWPTNAR